MEREGAEEEGESPEEVWEPPAITFREPLEALAVACTQPTAKMNQVSCPSGPANS